MSYFDKTKLDELAKPLDAKHVKQKPGGFGSYIEGWHAMAEANRVFGFDGWSSETTQINCVNQAPATWERWVKGERGKKETVTGHDVAYLAKVRITVGGIIREGVGAGTGRDLDLGIAHESAAKEAETDARKRALSSFGNVFGLALYDKEKRNVGRNVEALDMNEQRDEAPEVKNYKALQSPPAEKPVEPPQATEGAPKSTKRDPRAEALDANAARKAAKDAETKRLKESQSAEVKGRLVAHLDNVKAPPGSEAFTKEMQEFVSLFNKGKINLSIDDKLAIDKLLNQKRDLHKAALKRAREVGDAPAKSAEAA